MLLNFCLAYILIIRRHQILVVSFHFTSLVTKFSLYSCLPPFSIKKVLHVGPVGSPYEGGIFYLYLKVPFSYPFDPPEVRFLTKIFHPNVNRHGDVGIDSIQHANWVSGLTIPKASNFNKISDGVTLEGRFGFLLYVCKDNT